MSEVALNSLYSYLTSTLSPANQQWLASRLMENSSATQRPTPSAVRKGNVQYRTSKRIEALILHTSTPVPADIKMEDIYAEH